jgi:hypothetical protein
MEHLQVMRDALRAKGNEESNLTSAALPALSSEARDRIKLKLQQHD